MTQEKKVYNDPTEFKPTVLVMQNGDVYRLESGSSLTKRYTLSEAFEVAKQVAHMVGGQEIDEYNAVLNICINMVGELFGSAMSISCESEATNKED